mgnify:CR=1 FL=1
MTIRWAVRTDAVWVRRIRDEKLPEGFCFQGVFLSVYAERNDHHKIAPVEP